MLSKQQNTEQINWRKAERPRLAPARCLCCALRRDSRRAPERASRRAGRSNTRPGRDTRSVRGLNACGVKRLWCEGRERLTAVVLLVAAIVRAALPAAACEKERKRVLDLKGLLLAIFVPLCVFACVDRIIWGVVRSTQTHTHARKHTQNSHIKQART